MTKHIFKSVFYLILELKIKNNVVSQTLVETQFIKIEGVIPSFHVRSCYDTLFLSSYLS